MKKFLCIAIIGLLGSGCAGLPTVTLPADTAASLSGRSIARIVHEKPSFGAMTPAKGAFGMLGAVAMLTAGNALVAEHQIEDPALRLSGQLQQLLVTEYGMSATSDASVMAASDSVDSFRTLVPQADVALDVKTVGWNYVYNGFDFSHYKVGAQIQVRLIDLSTAEVLASNRCLSPEVPKDQMPTQDELLADNAALLKSRLAAIADHCTRTVAAEAFGIESAGEVVAGTP